jgi:predicted PolB exonuclease-like 3'-5' exonuclease
MSYSKLYFDIETLPATEESHKTLRYLYDRRQSKVDPDSERGQETFEEYLSQTSFDGAFGRVLVIAYAINDEPPKFICNPDNEKKTLEEFWQVASKIDVFVGHNIMDFDLRFILQRSAILGVKPTWNKFEIPGKKPWELDKFLSFARYRNNPIFDTMHEWSNWSRPNVGLEHIALAMNIPTPKDGIDGSEVAAFYEAGKVKEICDYCVRDVETTRAVYKRMTFESLPTPQTLPF